MGNFAGATKVREHLTYTRQKTLLKRNRSSTLVVVKVMFGIPNS